MLQVTAFLMVVVASAVLGAPSDPHHAPAYKSKPSPSSDLTTVPVLTLETQHNNTVTLLILTLLTQYQLP
ncbi:hypothetical protein Pmani_034355 [Petrolisthes manimaculis]|uniref:Uncharacterized protein n=1 Tax=Petrolisthes manimaculis TaxID=1843537 RepID=A0AAE1TRM2_9EUCA|nr:hypothetical protein Pmani_034355 [Petrolisthes manimaculis]